ncbi:hypothetical protein K3495_g6890 [Podosphaera aphanis]|nr:hypothetical protein K3495_g6890 [Podosphaera aphanis]
MNESPTIAIVGYRDHIGSQAVTIWIPSKNKVIRTRDATFDEKTFYDPKDLDIGAVFRESAEDIIQAIDIPEWKNWESETNIEDEDIIVDVPFNPYDIENFKPTLTQISDLHKLKNHDKSILSSNKHTFPQIFNHAQIQTENPSGNISSNKELNSSKFINSDIDVSNILTGKRIRKPKAFTTFHNSFAEAKNSITPTKLHRKDLPPPKNRRQIIQHLYSTGLKAAEQKEFNTLFEKKLCSKINIPEAKNIQTKHLINTDEILQLMWIYTYKFDADGYLLSFKARLVARGDLYNSTEETYAATLAAQVFRATIAISTVFNCKIRQYDIVAAYTNADLHHPELAHLPEGFETKECFLLIKKALYGLPESALLWQNHLQATFLNFGLSPVP